MNIRSIPYAFLLLTLLAAPVKAESEKAQEYRDSLERLTGIVLGICSTAKAAKLPKIIPKTLIEGVFDGARKNHQSFTKGWEPESEFGPKFIRGYIATQSNWEPVCKPYWPDRYRIPPRESPSKW